MRLRLLLAYFPGENVTSSFASTPTHLTLVSWFTIEEDRLAMLTEALCFILKQFGDIRATAAEEAMFGEFEEVPVHVMSPGSPLPQLHLTLLHAIEEMGGELDNPKWSGLRYQPHISKKPDMAFSSGDEFVIRSAHLIQAVSEMPKKRVIVESFRW